MTAPSPHAPSATPAPAPADATAREAREARLAQLFRHTLRHGGVNPLLGLVRRWREGDKP